MTASGVRLRCVAIALCWCGLACVGCAMADTQQQERAEWDDKVGRKRAQAAVNCTRFIPAHWRRWMSENEPFNDERAGLMRVPFEYLLACLRSEFNGVNDTSPFSLVAKPLVRYKYAMRHCLLISRITILQYSTHVFSIFSSIGLSHVVALGFNSILEIKARVQLLVHMQ